MFFGNHKNDRKARSVQIQNLPNHGNETKIGGARYTGALPGEWRVGYANPSPGGGDVGRVEHTWGKTHVEQHHNHFCEYDRGDLPRVEKHVEAIQRIF